MLIINGCLFQCANMSAMHRARARYVIQCDMHLTCVCASLAENSGRNVHAIRIISRISVIGAKAVWNIIISVCNYAGHVCWRR